MKILWIVCLTGSAAFAQGVQNMDFSFLFGPAITSATATAGPTGPGIVAGAHAAFSFQLNYGYQFAATKVGNLYLETPATFVFDPNASVDRGTVVAQDRNTSYFTPGLRLKIPTGTRLSFYAALGGGVANFHEVDVVVNGQVLAAVNSTLRPALDFGGGLDFRISRWFSLRADVRDFVSAAGFGGSTGHNHTVAVFGFAFHR